LKRKSVSNTEFICDESNLSNDIIALIYQVFPHDASIETSESLAEFVAFCNDFSITCSEEIIFKNKSILVERYGLSESTAIKIYTYASRRVSTLLGNIESHDSLADSYTSAHWNAIANIRFKTTHRGMQGSIVDSCYLLGNGHNILDISRISRSWVCLVCEPDHEKNRKRVRNTPAGCYNIRSIIAHGLSAKHRLAFHACNLLRSSGDVTLAASKEFSCTAMEFLENYECFLTIDSLAFVSAYIRAAKLTKNIISHDIQCIDAERLRHSMLKLTGNNDINGIVIDSCLRYVSAYFPFSQKQTKLLTTLPSILRSPTEVCVCRPRSL
jgi:hypothetical protein